MESLGRQGWLFTHGADSICITRNNAERLVAVCGPGALAQTYQFDTMAALEGFCDRYVNLLESTGWALHPLTDRRFQSGPLPVAGECRATGGPYVHLPHGPTRGKSPSASNSNGFGRDARELAEALLVQRRYG